MKEGKNLGVLIVSECVKDGHIHSSSIVGISISNVTVSDCDHISYNVSAIAIENGKVSSRITIFSCVSNESDIIYVNINVCTFQPQCQSSCKRVDVRGVTI